MNFDSAGYRSETTGNPNIRYNVKNVYFNIVILMIIYSKIGNRGLIIFKFLI